MAAGQDTVQGVKAHHRHLSGPFVLEAAISGDRTHAAQIGLGLDADASQPGGGPRPDVGQVRELQASTQLALARGLNQGLAHSASP